MLLPLLLVGISAVFILLFYIFTLNLRATQDEAANETKKLEYVLDMTKTLVIDRVYSSMELLKQKSLGLGIASIEGEVVLLEEDIPQLKFGKNSQTNRSSIVDDVTKIGNGTATIFVKKQSEFIRISTNVRRKSNNARAIGTRLDPIGKVITNLNAGKPFYGVVDILGEPYISGYEPIFDNKNFVIGAWYVGYKVNVIALNQAIKKWAFMKTGFAVITDYNDNIRFLSDHVSALEASAALKNTKKSWFVSHRNIPEWNFHAYIAMPYKDIYVHSLTPLFTLLILSGLVGTALMVLAQHGIKRFVLSPLGGEPETAYRLVKNIEQGNFEDDDTVAEPDTLIDNILTMRSRLHEMVAEIRENANRLSISSSVFQHSHDGIFITDPNANIIKVNPAFSDITGYPLEEAINQQPHQLGFAYQIESFFPDLFDSPDLYDGKRGEVWCRQKSGQAYAAWLDMYPVRNDDDELLHYVGLFSDNTIAKEQRNTLERLAYHDALTQLPNRVLFSDNLQKALAETQESQEAIAICYVDLDNFKPINDQYGHEVGDQLLVLLADRLRKNCRSQDTVARLGGDEFAILLRGLPTVRDYSGALDRILYAIEQAFNIDDTVFFISASIGFTVYPHDNNQPDTLLRHADHAMYHAKTHGGKQHHLFDLSLAQLSQDEQRLKQDVVEGLKNNQFLIHYQPQIDLKSGNVIGMEALIRWEHPTRGFLNPNDFLPVIGNTNLIIDIGEWVILNTLSQLEQWLELDLNFHVGVNIAAHHITNKSFSSFLKKTLKKHPNIAGNKINIEITESAAISDFARVTKIIEVCKKLGVTFSLDDFGVGYGSLLYLRRLPVDIIKIDPSFTRGMLKDSEDLAIVSSVVTLSREFNRKVIAEGAETNEQLHMLRGLSCTYAQGYGIAKPMPADEVVGWIKANQPFKY
ncbi:MAG: diguanylate cyclase (GGDEF)-like protein/PAS domain S-box-containing protein [Methylophilaceae bacterium]|jgi:diguanylate cyclase (GGDEF)-like protein/PAS domain S-box-containing protein